MNHHRVACHHCEDGKVYTSRYGGNDPDVWALKDPCNKCDGKGNLLIEDCEGVIPEGEIVMSFVPLWTCQDYSKRVTATYNRMSATGQEEADAVAALIEKVRDREEERQFEKTFCAHD